MKVPSLLLRKFLTSYVLSILTAIFFSILYLFPITKEDSNYYLAENFLGWTLVYGVYIIPVLLLYGGPISIGLEYIYQRGFFKKSWFYNFFHGLFGAIFGLFFLNTPLVLIGVLIGSSYATVDRLLSQRIMNKKTIWISLVSPIVILVLIWGGFQYVSDPLPPFTAQDAIILATEGEETLQPFPKKEGISKREIDGYYITYETKTEKMDDETYITSFSAKWSKNGKSDSSHIAYKVERNSTTLYQSDWNFDHPYNN
ncbi:MULTISPECIES: hypothetical protein [unclassified Virgibacillus]|uniref:hypothetical protein n=1 Tax=Virgibacillus TaxID=84406 RepID=UPI00090A386F|nr:MULTISPECIES: hypothetical protein [unclassified Virgibacillus]API93154.1 hypothetical protein BKP57_15875 [Virgibacillus sp. 6R]